MHHHNYKIIKCDNLNTYSGYIFGSSIITLVIASVSFLVALSWNTAIQKSFEYYEKGADEIEARFSFAFLITAISIVLIFMTIYFINGERI